MEASEEEMQQLEIRRLQCEEELNKYKKREKTFCWRRPLLLIIAFSLAFYIADTERFAGVRDQVQFWFSLAALVFVGGMPRSWFHEFNPTK